jgi:glutathionylspermidine synthase
MAGLEAAANDAYQHCAAEPLAGAGGKSRARVSHAGWADVLGRIGLLSFSAREIDQFEAATEEVQRLCLKAAQFILDHDRMDALGIPARAQPVIRAAWEAEPPSIYGRFDFAYDGEHPPKLLEYNANTPTALLEAAVVQWYWLQDVFPKKNQFNSIHEKLVAKWVTCGIRRRARTSRRSSCLCARSAGTRRHGRFAI